jgi:thiamine-phosphate pyrophosphorylase
LRLLLLRLKLFIVTEISKDFDYMAHINPHGTPLPRLFLISSGQENPENSYLLLKQLELLPRSLSCMVQIREKHLEAKQLFLLAQKAAEMDLPTGTRLLVNERADIALAAGLHGVHLPEACCPPDKIRAFAPDLLIGCSVHSPLSAHNAEQSGADYLLYGPVFDTPSKRKYGHPQGLNKLAALCSSTSLPVFAVGGITPLNAAQCMDNGAYGAAGISIFAPCNGFAGNFEQFYRALYQ